MAEKNIDKIIKGEDVFHFRDSSVPKWAKEKNKPQYTASEVGARSDDWLPSTEDINAVPTSRKVNGKALSSDLTLIQYIPHPLMVPAEVDDTTFYAIGEDEEALKAASHYIGGQAHHNPMDVVEIPIQDGSSASAKSGIDGYRIKWDMDDKFYTFGINKNDVLTEFVVESIAEYTGHAEILATYYLNVSSDIVPKFMERVMFYLGGFEKTKPMPQEGDEGVAIGMSIAEQTGKFEDIGNYQIIQTVVTEPNPKFRLDQYGIGLPVYDFDRAIFQSLTSIVKLDLSEYVGSEVSVSYEIEGENIHVCNAFNRIYYSNVTEDTKDGLYNKSTEQSEYIPGEVSVVAQEGETYLVLLPQTEWKYNTEMVFSVNGEVVGKVNFPNGVKQNTYYTAEGGGAIKPVKP